AHEAGGTPEQFLARKAKAKAKGADLGESLTSLSMQAQLASWPSPTTSRGPYSYRNGNHDERTLKLEGAAKLSAWPTPLRSDGDHQTASYGHGNTNPTLLGAARSSSWATPMRSDATG